MRGVRAVAPFLAAPDTFPGGFHALLVGVLGARHYLERLFVTTKCRVFRFPLGGGVTPSSRRNLEQIPYPGGVMNLAGTLY